MQQVSLAVAARRPRPERHNPLIDHSFDRSHFDRNRRALRSAAVPALEERLSEADAPTFASGRRRIDHVLVDGLCTEQVRPALDDVDEGAGGELRGNPPNFCSTESSTAVAVNAFAAFSGRTYQDPMLGTTISAPRFERPLRIRGVQAPVPPTPDVVIREQRRAVLIESKFLEPWRDKATTDVSTQYDRLAGSISPGTLATAIALREGDLTYGALGAAQLLKHLFGVHDAIAREELPAECQLVLAYWEPATAGKHQPLFDQLEAEFNCLADRLSDQSVALAAVSYQALWQSWAQPPAPEWLRQHSQRLQGRYGVDL